MKYKKNFKSKPKKLPPKPLTTITNTTTNAATTTTTTSTNDNDNIDNGNSNANLFSELNLSKQTLNGLNKANFVEMTTIQSKSLPSSLKGNDVLGAAKTGSGKTLAFLIPILEKLHQFNWNQYDGLGALVISPTRELALQIFELLRKIGRFHGISAGLLIGGKNLKQEQERVTKMNILIATPGRLLQHMDTTPDFNCDNLQMLVLDEADRIMDAGFQKSVNSIIENLPYERQTLLFSATLPKSVKDLARLSLKDPEYISVHANLSQSTPENLIQKYLVCELEQKLDILFSFIKTHLKSKIIIFLSSCKQVRFVHDTFCKIQPGIQLMCLHGKQKQTKRMAIFDEFCRKKSVCMFATDIAARGLDFPAVDWVVQLDCPEDANTYIHRVGRTARYESKGNALMFLLPSEEPGMLELLNNKKVFLSKTSVNPNKLTFNIPKLLQSYCFADPEIKYLGQCALKSYLKSVYLGNKRVFDVSKLNIPAFAESLGLPGIPKLKFLSKTGVFKAEGMAEEVSKKKQKNKTLAVPSSLPFDHDFDLREDVEDDDAHDGQVGNGTSKQNTVVTKIDRMFKRKNMNVLSEHYQSMIQSDNDEDDDQKSNDLKNVFSKMDERKPKHNQENNEDGDDSFMVIRRKDHELEESELPDLLAEKASEMTKRHLLKLKRKEIESRGLSKKIIFDDEGNAIDAFKMESLEEYTERIKGDLQNNNNDTTNHGVDDNGSLLLIEAALKHAEEARAKMASVDLEDKKVEKQKRREKKLERKRREKDVLMMQNGGHSSQEEEHGVQLAPYEEEEDNDEVSDIPSSNEQDHDDDNDYMSDDSDEEEDFSSQQKKRKMKSISNTSTEPVFKRHKLDKMDANDLENLALSLLT